MASEELVAVTGAFSYTGKYIARRLLVEGKHVLNLTRNPSWENELGDRLKSVLFNFDNPDALTASLGNVTTLYNTYWIRFNYGSWTFDQAVQNTHRMIQSAKKAGVQRIVHISVTNPTINSPLPYFRGKAALEKIVQECGLSYAIIRPTLIFGKEDILINNIVYLLRRFPIFAIPGKGDYRLQPISAEETAQLCIRAGETQENLILDAAGPEILTFREMVTRIRDQLGSRAWLRNVPASFALMFSRLIGGVVGDIILTGDELRGLMSELLVSKDPPYGQIRLEDWLKDNIHSLGMNYVSELKRNYLPFRTDN